MSMLATPVLFIAYEFLSRFAPSISEEAAAPDAIDEKGPVIIVGIGRFGQVVNRLVRSSGLKTVVLDHDMKAIALLREFGYKGFFGDPTRPDLLHAAGLKEAQVLVVALDNPEDAVRLVRFARRERPDLHIIARARDRGHVFQLFHAGANDIVREMFDSSLRAGRYVLENAGLTEYEAAATEQAFYARDRESMLELAELWDPKIETSKNKAYLARARDLEKDLEISLTNFIEQRETEGGSEQS